MLRYDDDDDDNDNDDIDTFLGNLLQGENDPNSFSDNDSEKYHCTKNGGNGRFGHIYWRNP